MEFHADDVFGTRQFAPEDLPLLKAALSKMTPWTPEERRVVELALEVVGVQDGRRLDRVKDLAGRLL